MDIYVCGYICSICISRAFSPLFLAIIWKNLCYKQITLMYIGRLSGKTGKYLKES